MILTSFLIHEDNMTPSIRKRTSGSAIFLKKTGSQDDQKPRYEALKFHFHRTDRRHPQPCYQKQGWVNELGGGNWLIGENQLYQLYSCILINKKTFQGTLGTQDLTSIGSKTSLGPSMDPTGPLSWTLWFLRKFWAVYTNSTFSILQPL